MSPKPIVIIGLGELGSLFGRAFLRLGHPVVPVLRGMSAAEIAAHTPDPELTLVAVAEPDLDGVLASLPDAYRDRVVLLQNELLPHAWQRHLPHEPTVAVVWFEKKAGRAVKVVEPTRVFGPKADLIARALERESIPVERLDSEQLRFELVSKNLYILSINLAGLRSQGTVEELREEHGELLQAVAREVLDLQEALLGTTLPRAALLERLNQALNADPAHVAMGRSAPARLARALEQAGKKGVPVPTLRAIAEQIGIE